MESRHLFSSYESDHLEERAILELTRNLGFHYERSTVNNSLRLERGDAMSTYYLRVNGGQEKAYPFYFINDHDSSRLRLTV